MECEDGDEGESRLGEGDVRTGEEVVEGGIANRRAAERVTTGETMIGADDAVPGRQARSDATEELSARQGGRCVTAVESMVDKIGDGEAAASAASRCDEVSRGS